MKFFPGRACTHIGLFVGIALTLTLIVPASSANPRASQTGNYRGQCRQLTKQINHYENSILPLAIARGNRKWERATSQQVERLWHRRADLCPAYGAERTFLVRARDQIRQFNKMVDVASRAAVAFFTGGLSGGIGP